MKRNLGFLLVFSLITLLVAGCVSSHDPILQGDVCVMSGEYDRAVQWYEKALETKPSLARKPEFTQKLQRAKVDAAVAAGMASARKQRWDEALAAFATALRQDSEHTLAKQQVEAVRRAAGDACVQEALRLADAGQLGDALQSARRALAYDPANSHAAAALRSVNLPADATPAERQAQADYEKALAFSAAKEWQAQADAISKLLAAAPDQLPARIQLGSARRELAASRDQWQKGVAALANKQVDEAAGFFAKALDIWPGNPEAASALADANARRGKFDRLLREAQEQEKKGAWDMAVAAARAAEELQPRNPAAAGLPQRIASRGCNALVVQGSGLMQANRLDEARKAFAAALLLVPGQVTASDGLAAIAAARAAAASKAGNVGEALLWSLEAAESASLITRNQYQESLNQARSLIVARGFVPLQLSAVPNAPDRAVTDALQLRVSARIAARAPLLVMFADGKDPKCPPLFAATIGASALNVQARLESTEQRIFEYTQMTDVPNPEIPRLQVELQQAQTMLFSLRQAMNTPCGFCGGNGYLICGRCQGAGWFACMACRGAGKRPGIGGAQVICTACGGSLRINCPACRHGRIPCRTCNGTGRYSTVDWYDVHRKESEVSSLERRLHTAPTMVRIATSAQWPYTVEHHRKTGALEGSLRVTRADGTLLEGGPVTRSFIQDADAIPNANPAIGLQPRPLQLTDDETVRRNLLDGAADECAVRILRAILAQRVQEFRDAAVRAAAENRTHAEFDAAVTAALLLESMDSAQAAKQFRSLRDRLKGM